MSARMNSPSLSSSSSSDVGEVVVDGIVVADVVDSMSIASSANASSLSPASAAAHQAARTPCRGARRRHRDRRRSGSMSVPVGVSSSDADSSGRRTSPSPPGTRSVRSSERGRRLAQARALVGEVTFEVIDVGLEEVASGSQRVDLGLDVEPLGLAGSARFFTRLVEQPSRHLTSGVDRLGRFGCWPPARSAQLRPWPRRRPCRRCAEQAAVFG